MWRDTGSGELHCDILGSSPSGSHTLPLALPFAAQPVACQCPGTVNTVGANNLPKPTVTDQGATHRHAITQPSPTLIVPRQQADKSQHNQHVAPILHLGTHHLQHQEGRPEGRPSDVNGPSSQEPDMGRHLAGCSTGSVDFRTRWTSSALIASS